LGMGASPPQEVSNAELAEYLIGIEATQSPLGKGVHELAYGLGPSPQASEDTVSSLAWHKRRLCGTSWRVREILAVVQR
jgi:hypothetical protein